MIINHPSSHHQMKAWQTGGVHVRTLDAANDPEPTSEHPES